MDRVGCSISVFGYKTITGISEAMWLWRPETSVRPSSRPYGIPANSHIEEKGHKNGLCARPMFWWKRSLMF